MNVLIPVDRYRVDYEVGCGVPFSMLDLLVLKAVANDHAADLPQLAKTMSLPKRLLIESLVGLARVGWVAIGGSSAGFTPTAQGRNALAEAVPPEPEQITNRQGFVLVERLTGLICSISDLTYTTKRKLIEDGIWEDCIKLTRDPNLPRLDRGQVKPHLQHDKKEWIRWVGEPYPHQHVWLRLHIDKKTNRVDYLPEAWRTSLTPRIATLLNLPLLSSERSEKNGSRKYRLSVPNETWETDSTSTLLLSDHTSHVETLMRALAEAKANTHVLIASAFASADVITKYLAEPIKSAIARKVRVDLLWGYSAGKTVEENKQTVKALDALRKETEGWHMLRFNQTPTGSHAKLLAWDAPNGFNVCVGSHNWLSVPHQKEGVGATNRELSVVTNHPGVAAAVCTTIAGFWSAPQLEMSAVPDLWHHTAGLLERQAAAEFNISETSDERNDPAKALDTAITIKLVRDQEHEALMRDMLLTANHRVAVTSHKLGPKAPIRLESLRAASEESSPSVKVRIFVGEVLPEDSELVLAVEACARRAGGTFSILSGLHAKVVLADDAVLVSSYNFLSADPFGTATDAREVGFYLQGKAFADAAWTWVESLR